MQSETFDALIVGAAAADGAQGRAGARAAPAVAPAHGRRSGGGRQGAGGTGSAGVGRGGPQDLQDPRSSPDLSEARRAPQGLARAPQAARRRPPAAGGPARAPSGIPSAPHGRSPSAWRRSSTPSASAASGRL